MASESSERVKLSPVAGEPVPTSGTGLCLSGGGYRAMLFHAGVLRRLNDGGWLPRLDRVSSVSGGSITAGVLAASWPELTADSPVPADVFEELIEQPLRRLARSSLDKIAVVEGALSPFSTIAEQVADAFDDKLFHGRRLGDLPKHPRFVFNATNLASGALVRFDSAPYVADWRVGRINDPQITLATAVTCSAAFPPFLSPFRLHLDGDWTTDLGNLPDCEKYRDELVLTDGGVYDNLGLETAKKNCRTLIVSDGGGGFLPDPKPHGDWPRQIVRVLHVIDNQVRSLRKRDLINAFDERPGVYLGIRSDIIKYPAPNALPAPVENTMRLAELDTRLAKLPDETQGRLINWGYAIADAGLAAWLPDDFSPQGFPHPGGVG